jgi:hypothetical protein
LSTTRLIRYVTHYVPGQRFNCLCFGLSELLQHSGSRPSVYHFRPGQIFAPIWWRREDDDRQHRTLAIVEALHHEEEGQELPDIRGKIAIHAMVDQHGPAGQAGAVDMLMDLIEDLKHRQRNPAGFTAEYWRSMVHRIMLCQPSLQPRSGTVDEELLCIA